MAKSAQAAKADQGAATSAPWKPPAVPTMTEGEIDEAVRWGGFPGILGALRAKASPIPLADPRDAAAVASLAIDQYRAGHGAGLQAAILATIDTVSLSVALMSQALNYAAAWVDANPGKVVSDAGHSSGQRRIFDNVAPAPPAPSMGVLARTSSGEDPSSVPAAYRET